MKIVITSIGLSLVSVFVADVVHIFGFSRIDDIIAVFMKKYLIFQITKTDLFLFRYFPLLVAVFFLFYDKKTPVKRFIWVNLRILGAILLFLFIGIIAALLIWPSLDTNYLPDNVLIQPFTFYWTLFILSGIVLPIYLWLRKKSKKSPAQDLIDDEIKQY